ncbi:MAG: hypothetical protein AAGC44_06775 [Planctomycetota bacterium]
MSLKWMTRAALALLALAFFPSAPVQAQELEADEQARIDRLWNRYWREVAPFYVRHGDSFICVPGYDRRLPSSVGMTASAYQRDSAREVTYQEDNGRERTRTEVKPDQEAEAATKALPELEPGVYGHILSGVVKEVVDGETVILENIWLIDAEQMRQDKREAERTARQEAWSEVENRFRGIRDGRRNRGDTVAEEAGDLLNYINWCFEDREDLASRQREAGFRRTPWRIIGFQTRTLTEGNRWPSNQSLQLVILSVSRNEVVAIPAAKIGNGLNELEFLDCLASRTMTKAQFVDLYTEARREHRTAYLPAILSELEGIEFAAEEEDDRQEQGGPGEVRLAD